jgi:site-specific DNA-methyltransferase (adenine-specific)
MKTVQIGNATLILGDCLEAMKTMPDNSVDSVVCDPPYGLSFMGKKWDYDVPSQEIWAECLRVLKPGGHLLAFAGTRTQHRMAVRIEDAGFEIRDMIAWVYGSGFPKSMDISKAIDKQAGVEREDKFEGAFERRAGPTGNKKCDACGKWLVSGSPCQCPRPQDEPTTEAAKQWQGWGTALKPALEPITVARKPLSEKTVASNVLEHGTGGLNIDGCRVSTEDKLSGGHASGGQQMTGGWERPWMKDPDAVAANAERSRQSVAKAEELGRWPANLIHDGSDEVTGLFPTNAGAAAPVRKGFDGASQGIYGDYASKGDDGATFYGDKGSAARFFYCAKSSKRDRDEGLEGFEAKATAFGNQAQAELKRGNLDHDDGKSGMNKVKMRQNSHPTVKPTDLMRYLCRLVTQPGGVVLDPFMGSGSTGKAAMLEGFQFIGCEMSPEYFEIAKARIEAVKTEPTQKDMFVSPK